MVILRRSGYIVLKGTNRTLEARIGIHYEQLHWYVDLWNQGRGIISWRENSGRQFGDL
jgi:hypothetical protein